MARILSSASTDLLRIFTFGGWFLQKDSAPITGPVSRKAEGLIVYLACNPQLHAREQLAGLLWDNLAEDRTLTNLRIVLSSLHKQLAPYMTITRRAVGINPDSQYWIDQ